MKKKVLFLCVIIIIIIFIIIIKSCSFSSAVDDKGKEKGRSENITTNILKSSNTYFIGKWSIHYNDIVHYAFDDQGVPTFNLYKQPRYLFFSEIGKALVLEEEYAVTESQHNDVNFRLSIQLRIATLIVKGTIENASSWEGELEYYSSEGGQLLSKCRVVATRIK